MAVWFPQRPVGKCGYGSKPISTIFSGMNIHLPAILMFTRGTRVLTHPPGNAIPWHKMEALIAAGVTRVIFECPKKGGRAAVFCGSMVPNLECQVIHQVSVLFCCKTLDTFNNPIWELNHFECKAEDVFLGPTWCLESSLAYPFFNLSW